MLCYTQRLAQSLVNRRANFVRQKVKKMGAEAKLYSQRHERRVKKQCIAECTASLAWLEEGLTPIKLVVLNSETNEVNQLTLRKDLVGFGCRAHW